MKIYHKTRGTSETFSELDQILKYPDCMFDIKLLDLLEVTTLKLNRVAVEIIIRFIKIWFGRIKSCFNKEDLLASKYAFSFHLFVVVLSSGCITDVTQPEP